MTSNEIHFGDFQSGTIQFLPTVSSILFGTNVIRESLVSEISRLDAHKILLMTPYSMRSSGISDLLKTVLKDSAVEHIAVSAEHVPLEVLADILSQVGEQEPDAVIALGGGSTIDLAKGLRVFMSLGIRSRNEIIDFIHSPYALGKSPCPQISIPTTLSGSEYTRSFSVTDFINKKKLSLTETLCSSQTIIYDPAATRDTTIQLWSSSGVMALNHAIEVLVTSQPNIISDSLKLTSAANLLEYLPTSAGMPGTPEIEAARGVCQVASWMADHSPIRVRTKTNSSGILYGHALAYQIASQYKVPYGLIACTTLISCLRHYSDWDVTLKNRIAQISSGLTSYHSTFLNRGPLSGPINLIDLVENLISQLGLPSRLRDVGVPENGLDELAYEFSSQNSNGSEQTARMLAARASQILKNAW